MNHIQIAIADDHPMLIKGLVTMLEPYSQLSVIATYNNATQILEGLAIAQPDILLLDILMPEQSGKDMSPSLLKSYPDMKILVLTSMDTPAMVSTMFRRGCKGYLLKDAEPEIIVEAIETIYNGGEYIDAALKEQIVQNVMKFKDGKQQNVLPKLTQREKEILQLIALEYTTVEIAQKLFISFRTAVNHRNNLMQKLDVKNAIGLVKIAIQLGLINH